MIFDGNFRRVRLILMQTKTISRIWWKNRNISTHILRFFLTLPERTVVTVKRTQAVVVEEEETSHDI